jgi:asparagine synthase (glutamine-hydrolysing)
MCGINGFTWSDDLLAEKMNDLIEHRGPDDRGTLVEDGVSLGNCRLAIIDLSPSGHQPMKYVWEDREVWITYNGEIYNYKEVRAELVRLGYRFTSESDTEVILAAYLHWGTECVDRFNGMWAFAIYDKKEKTIFLSRDRFGIKPLYFHYDGRNLIFSSEIKAIFAHPIVRKPNDQAVFDYLYHGLHDHGPETFFDGIRRLLPGQSGKFEFGSRKLDLWTYYDLKKRIESSKPMTPEEFRRLFFDAIRLHMVSDVPVGSCLSGGLDSTSVLCAMREEDPKAEIKVFSLGFPGDKIDESQYQVAAAREYGVNRFMTTFTSDDLLENIRDLIHTQEEPFYDLTIYGQYEVMRLAHEHGMKVLLDGQGADEILAGYYYQAAYYYYDLLQRGRLVKLFRELAARNGPNPQTTRFFLGLMLPMRLKRYIVARDRKFLRPEFVQKCKSPDSRFQRKTLTEALVEAVTRTSLPSLLRYEDKNSMRWSIESRVPFLDYRLVEAVLALPNEAKIDGGISKVILRQGLHGRLPPMVENRRDKLGFATPEKRLLSAAAAEKAIQDILGSEAFRNRPYWNPDKVRLLIPRVAASSRFQILKSDDLWRVILLEIWLEEWIDNPKPGRIQPPEHGEKDVQPNIETQELEEDIESVQWGQ